MSQSIKSSGIKVRKSLKKDSGGLFKDGFNWDKYLQACNLPAAPLECFTQSQTEKLKNNFQIESKLEAQDPRNPTSICLATVVALQGPRILIRLDGGDACNDFWRLVDSEDIYPLGTHEGRGILLQPPLGFTKNMSTWSSFLAKNREKGQKAEKECFLPKPSPPESNLFEIGMKIEAVDRKNPDLICPATIGDIKADQVFISFDGWRGAMDFWCEYTSRDLFPVGWCQDNDHPLSNPGTKGDNPAVVDKLKILAENAKRKTRSGALSMSESEKMASKMRADTPPLPTKYESLPHLKGSRGRSRMRQARTNPPVAKPQSQSQSQTEKEPSENFSQPRSSQDHAAPSVTESSHESETGDSSVSSDDSSDSSDNEDDNDEKFGSGDDSEIDESIVEIKRPSSSQVVGGNVTGDLKQSPKSERKDKNRSAKEMKNRKRYASLGDEDYDDVNTKKMKKDKRKHSLSSMFENHKERMVGFGKPSSTVSSNENQKSNIQSPSFVNSEDSPTSLFGFNRDEIVKKATEGWPSRLMMNSKSVVTSDNKLARFGSQNVADSSCNDDADVKQESETAVVTTTTKALSTETVDNEANQCKTPESESGNRISSQTVSSTTNPIQVTARSSKLEPNLAKSLSRHTETIETPSTPPVVKNPLPSNHLLPRKHSRNPQRWTVGDVIDYVRDNEPALAPLVHLFQIHEIDGPALMLVNSTIAVKYMSMKLGPALKLANLVEKVKELVPPPVSPK